MIRNEIQSLIKKAIKDEFGQIKMPEIGIEKPENKEFGDYFSNIALQLAKILKKKPMDIAKRLNSKFQIPNSRFFEAAKIVKPGFINFYLSQEYLQNQVGEILKSHPPKFPKGKFGKVNVEFISANPTGPLTLGNGRGGFFGDVLANVLSKAGYKVEREYYINDVGEQIKKLGEGVYDKVKEVREIRKKIKEKHPYKLGEKTAKEVIQKLIKPAVKKDMKINFDKWFSEKTLYEKKEVDKVLNFLKKKKLAYEKDGALWFKSSQFGDDKDRVLIKKDGEKTYFTSDIAYLKNKFERGFDKLIYIWGADHHGYIERLKAAGQAFGYDPEKIKIIIVQLVRLTEKGKEVRMSKRAGTFVTLEELIDMVGLDVTRFFFLTRSPNSHMNFDLSLAKERSEKNPVYYVQYAFARISSILRKAQMSKSKCQIKSKAQNPKLLTDPSEMALVRQLIRLPEVIEDTTKDYQIQRLPNYALELVTAFHKFYEQCRVISDNEEITQARLSLIQATRIVLKIILDLMGISAPEKM